MLHPYFLDRVVCRNSSSERRDFVDWVLCVGVTRNQKLTFQNRDTQAGVSLVWCSRLLHACYVGYSGIVWNVTHILILFKYVTEVELEI